MLPGITLNLSAGGISTSVGVRGARVTFGKRGTYSNLGIPGTGISDRTRLDGGGPRRISDREHNAEMKRIRTSNQVSDSTRAVTEADEAYTKLLNSWRIIPHAPSDSDFNDACEFHTFEFLEQAPIEPDIDLLRKTFWDRLHSDQIKLHDPRIFQTTVAVVTLLVAVGLSAFSRYGIAVVATMMGVLGIWWLGRHKKQIAKEQTDIAFHNQWPDENARIESDNVRNREEYNARLNQAEQEWSALESSRVEWARRLCGGDASAIYEAINATIAEIELPPKTHCDVFLNDGAKIFLKLGLPKIDDIIEDTTKKVLKDGRIKEVKKPALDANLEYARLACGLGIQIACHVFCCGPTIASVEVAAYTPRIKRAGLPEEDCCVVRFEMSRIDADAKVLSNCDPIIRVSAMGGLVDTSSNGKLKEVPQPSWC